MSEQKTPGDTLGRGDSEKAKHFGNDCYSRDERAWMEFGQRGRRWLLGPLLGCLSDLGVKPDGITIFSGIMGLAFVPLWLAHQSNAALACLLAHVLLDGLDGPLARYQARASARGSFTDTFVDQLVVTLVMLAWMMTYPSNMNIATAGIYTYLYSVVVAMAMVRNSLAIPFSWLVRPRFFVFSSIALDAWMGTDWTMYVLVVCDLLLAMKLGSGFLKLRGKLPGPEPRVSP